MTWHFHDSTICRPKTRESLGDTLVVMKAEVRMVDLAGVPTNDHPVCHTYPGNNHLSYCVTKSLDSCYQAPESVDQTTRYMVFNPSKVEEKSQQKEIKV